MAPNNKWALRRPIESALYAAVAVMHEAAAANGSVVAQRPDRPLGGAGGNCRIACVRAVDRRSWITDGAHPIS
jgi:hypothetical protein